MRNILILVLLFSFTTAKAQESLSKEFNISVPNKIQKADQNEIISYSKKNYKHSTITKDFKNIYRVGNILVSFWDLNSDQTLSQTKINLEGIILNRELHQNNIIDESKIILHNNIQFYIIKYHNENEYRYMFYSESRNSKTINGFVHFKIEDKEKADKIFDDLIKSISFKKIK